MQLGWIDFSKDDRGKTLDVLNLLKKREAVDELSIGTVRNAFSNYFFPGTSTIQTRAKYFLIVPYAIRDIALNNKYKSTNEAMEMLESYEINCGNKLRLGKDIDGVVGIDTLPDKWVSRTPADIYWSGIRRYRIFNYDMSIESFFRVVQDTQRIKNINKKLLSKKDEGEMDSDDSDAGDIQSYHYFNLPKYRSNWIDTLSVELTGEEADYLTKQILKSVPDSLIAYILKKRIDIEPYNAFRDFTESIVSDVSEEMKLMIQLANDFNEFVYAARVRYNYILSSGKNVVAVAEWNRIKKNMQNLNVDTSAIMNSIRITDPSAITFTRNLIDAMHSGDEAKIDEIIILRESLKGPDKAKLNHIGETKDSSWVGGTYLDYRFETVKKIVKDIYKGFENATTR